MSNHSNSHQIECRAVGHSLRSGDHDLEILRDVDLVIEAGEFVAIVGPSGSGKSTLLGLLAGLERPTRGSIRFEGHPLESSSEDELALWRREEVGFVFQSFQLLGNLTARENVLLPLELTGESQAQERATQLLAAVGLSERGHHYPSQLSGGEQQRVALARAFGHRPAVLFADEPTGNLDSETGSQALELLLQMREEHGTTLVLITHDSKVADRAQRRLHLIGGRLRKPSEAQESSQ
jgi:putative ABC transport system ATP-binding protein